MPQDGASTRILATVLFTDIVDSTSHNARLGDAKWAKLLQRHNRTTRTRLKRHGGTEIDTAGDGFLALFDSPSQGVLAALEISQAVSKLGIDIRAGLHTGECEQRGESVYGIAVHIASRIADLAGAREVLVSATVKDLIQGTGITVSPRGKRMLRGVEGRWPLFDVGSVPQTPTKAAGTKKKGAPQGRPVVLLVDDHPLWRQTLRNVLLRSKVASRVVEASGGQEAIDVAERIKPGLVVMDMQMPDMHGVEATRVIKERAPETHVLVLSSSDEKAQVLDAVRAGASGYVLKSAEPADVVDAVRRIHRGELVFPAELASVVLSELKSPTSGKDRASALGQLTARERVVLELMADGLSNFAISNELSLSPKTVESHVAAVFSKLGLEDSRDEHRRVTAVVRFLQSGESGN